MKRDFAHSLRCPSCLSSAWELQIVREDEREIRDGVLHCSRCGSDCTIRNGIANFLDPNDETLQREVRGWIEMAGPLGEHLVSTMTALPYYPHDPWPQVAPDFLQIFEYVSFEGARVVDIGAGRTWSSRHLATIGRAREVVALDVLTTRFLGMETADIFFQEDSIFFERICADLHRMPLRDGWADVVFSCASLHHSSDLGSLYREVWRVLRPGGLFVFISEPCKKMSIPDRQPQNEEVVHGINEHIYNLSEYLRPLRHAGFTYRRLAPRSIRYRLLYRDKDFDSGTPRVLLRLTKTEPGRTLVTHAVRNRWLGPLLYRYWNLPLTVVARKSSPWQ